VKKTNLDQLTHIFYKYKVMEGFFKVCILVTVFCICFGFSSHVLAAKKKVKQVVIEEVTKVEGKIQKPEVWYLLPRSNLNFEGIKLEKKLVPKIEESTKKAPF
jgi:hypothetical protein